MSLSLSPLPTAFTARLTMESDWHVGSGAGRPGDVDRLVTRDADGLPYVPAKTLSGIWRDACERLALGLDEGLPKKPWEQWVEYVFGEQPARKREEDEHPDAPLGAALSIRSAHYPAGLGALLCGDGPRARAFQGALTFVQPGVKINEASGRADDDHLRFVEMARGGGALTADCRLRIDPNLALPASALLIAGAALVERLGGKRRRGAGLCRLELLDAQGRTVPLPPAVEWLRANASATVAPERPRLAPSATAAAAPEASREWVCVPLAIELLTPVAVGYRTVGNVLESLDFIPGTYLLPHVTRVLEALGLPSRAAIARGEVRVLNATISIDDKPGRPTPRCFAVEKGVETLEDPQTSRNRLRVDCGTDAQYKEIRKGYLGRMDGTTMAQYTKVALLVRTHNTVHEEEQRPTQDIGGVYSYEAIDPRRDHRPAVFRTELRIRTSLVPQREAWWTQFATEELELGRSKKDDYGRVRVNAEPPRSPVIERESDKKYLYVWALSDVLLRDAYLRPAPNVAELQRVLERRLGVELVLRKDSDGDPRAFVRVRRVESWNVGWGLPRPTLVALEAGSCACFVFKDPLDGNKLAEVESKLAEVEAEGVGERTAEGFGQISFNDPVLCRDPEHPALQGMKPPLGSPRVRQGEPAYAAACALEECVWRETIRRAALAFAANEDKVEKHFHWNERKPPMTQLGALRDAIHTLQDSSTAQAIQDGWLKGVRVTANRRDKWPEGALVAIENLLTRPHLVWEWIRAECATEWYTLTDDAEQRLRGKLWALAVRSLIDACVRAHKRRLDSVRA